MSRLSPGARKAISQRIDAHADEVDTDVLTNRVLEADDGAPEALYHIAQTVARSYHAMSCTRDIDADETPVHDAMSESWRRATDALDDYVEQLVAKECASVIQHADEMAERRPDYRDPEDYEDAKFEARQWLQEHIDAAERAGVLEDLDVCGAAQ